MFKNLYRYIFQAYIIVILVHQHEYYDTIQLYEHEYNYKCNNKFMC